jgi:RNA polymerase sigma-70 factor (ECF subfamily)
MPATVTPDDDGIAASIRAVRRGDADAYGAVVERFERRLFGLLLMVTRDPGAAEEIAQDAFVRAFMKLDAYDASRPFYPWLSTIAVRLAQNWLVGRTRRAAVQAGLADDHPLEDRDAVDALDRLLTDERDRQLWRAVAQLSSGQRTAALLFYRQGLSIDEVAAALGVSGGTVKTLLFRARQRLLTLLTAEEGSSHDER